MDAAISCLAPPPALNFADAAAFARALHFSSISSSDSGATSSFSAPHHQHRSPLLDLPAPCYVTTTCDSVLVADSPAAAGGRRHQHQQLAPAGGRAGKRRSRASKRAPTTYISTDPANFRIMVQQITGAQAEPGADDMVAETMLLQPTSAVAVLMAAAYGNANPLLMQAVAGRDEASALEQQQQPPCFPTLDSWNVMYERTGELL